MYTVTKVISSLECEGNFHDKVFWQVMSFTDS